MTSAAGSLPCVTVLTPTLADNALFRTHTIVKLLEPHYRVQLIGFGRDTDSYAPLAGDASMQPALRYYASNVWGFRRRIRALASKVEGQVLVCVKPLITSFGAGLLLRNWLGRPLVLDVDDWERGFLFPGALEWEMRYFGPAWFTAVRSPLYTRWLEGRVGNADAILTSNTFLQGMFGGHWIPHLRDMSHFVTAEAASNDDRKTVLFAGTPRPHKGLPTLLEAWKLLGRRDAVLALYVSDPEDTRRLVVASGAVPDSVEVHRARPFSEVGALLASASVVVVPQENVRAALGQLPAKLLDAMAAARPIVATDVGDTGRWLAGGAGVVVTPGSPSDLASGIAYVLDNPAEAVAMGQRARARLAREASFDILSTRLHQVLEAALNGVNLPATPAFGGSLHPNGASAVREIPA